ncbi:4573_t:CDS:2, partial [Entrophospora sp. SA101]
EAYKEDCIQPTVKFGGGSMMFGGVLQDKAPCHTSNYSVWWMKTHDIPILDWVVQ